MPDMYETITANKSLEKTKDEDRIVREALKKKRKRNMNKVAEACAARLRKLLQQD